MKIYFAVDGHMDGYKVNFLDMRGQRVTWGDYHLSVRDAIDAFQSEHPSAVFLAWDAFQARIGRIEADKQRLAAWNQGLSL